MKQLNEREQLLNACYTKVNSKQQQIVFHLFFWKGKEEMKKNYITRAMVEAAAAADESMYKKKIKKKCVVSQSD